MELKQIAEAINQFIRPATFPLALRMCESAAELPEKARIPTRDLGHQVAACQAIGLARRYGWTMAVGNEEQNCPYGAVMLGFLPAKKEFLEGNRYKEGMPGSREAAAKSFQEMARLPYGEYSHMLVAPLERATFEPHIIVVYGNSAQVMRLVQAVVYGRGGWLPSRAAGAWDCSEIVARTMLTHECQFALPSGGSRIWGMALDEELAFAMPWSKAEQVAAGLETSHRDGLRYPILYFMRQAAQFPPHMQSLLEYLKQPEQRAT